MAETRLLPGPLSSSPTPGTVPPFSFPTAFPVLVDSMHV
ncbi:unnamed protein product [Linum tenue]|uniref:Uncharacterized protein n=1 Tax=Linum tenue TaxID=586396 RepID=A0AAV0LW70_9ROSI|nr:unnamed protein product [Linum tenue]